MWRVLEIDGDKIFFLAEQGLDVQPYNGVFEDAIWETCSARQWLNSAFFAALIGAQATNV